MCKLGAGGGGGGAGGMQNIGVIMSQKLAALCWPRVIIYICSVCRISSENERMREM